MLVPFEIWASAEATVARIDASSYRDQLRETGHEGRESDLGLLASLGISATRYPILWEKTAPIRPDALELRWASRRLERLRELGIEPVVTLLHHGSGPNYTSLIDSSFPEKFAQYAGSVAAAFPWVRRWTPINEPLTTARFATLYGVWYPNVRHDHAAFGAAVVHQALGMLLAMEAIRRHAPEAEFVITEDLQSFLSLDPSVDDYVAHKRRRMYLSIELVMGRIRPGHESYAYLVETCGVLPSMLERIERHANAPDLVGWNYYPNSQRALGMRDGMLFNDPLRLHAPISPAPLLRAAHERLGLPFGISEVHIDAGELERAAWLEARARDLVSLHYDGLPVRMLGAWAAFGLLDWNSLLTRKGDHREDGVFTFAAPGDTPRETEVAQTVRRLATSARAEAIATSR